jgi:hypothetical protein
MLVIPARWEVKIGGPRLAPGKNKRTYLKINGSKKG